ncbi:MAG TPA: translation elongation factor Ts [Gaiellaceae bacterium]|nr:translation elongation factor Ts [Gaiellaceae bacterium]
MSEIPAALVKELRERSGAGMMDCKRALQEAEGDIDEAYRLLREWGAAQAGKRAGREATEGVVLASIKDGVGTLVAVGAETDFVAKNDEFQAFANRVLEAVEREGPAAVESLEDERTELIGKIGENIVVRGAARLEATDGERLAEYVHRPANKIGVLVKVEGGDEHAARRLAMHIASAAPRWRTRADVPAEEVEAERKLFAGSDEVQSKPEQARDRIVEGMLNKRFFAAYPGGALLDQPWIHDTGKTVAQALDEEGLKVLEFARYALAE